MVSKETKRKITLGIDDIRIKDCTVNDIYHCNDSLKLLRQYHYPSLSQC